MIKIRRNSYPRLFPSAEWLEAQKTIPLKQRILEFIYWRRGVTFTELIARLGDEARGKKELGLPEFNIVFWQGLSKEFGEAFQELEREGYISKYMNPMNFLAYLYDGQVLELPIAKRINYKYKSPRWMPILLNPTEKCKGMVVDDEEAHR